jgi:hypothetical protein
MQFNKKNNIPLIEGKRNSSNSSISTNVREESVCDIEEVPRYATRNTLPKSKIGTVRDGFWINSNINPITRYNFVIERYNQDINKYNDIELYKIPFNSLMSKIFDIYIFSMRLVFAIFLMIKTGIAYKLGSKSYDSHYKYYAYNQTRKNWILVLFSIICLFSIAMIIYYCYFILVLTCIFGIVLTFYGQIYVARNERLIDRHFYKKMIYDKDLDTTNKLNDYITISPGTVESFNRLPYYKILLFLYNNRDQNVPQQLMTYSSNFVKELKIIRKSLINHLLWLIFIIVLGTMFFFH